MKREAVIQLVLLAAAVLVLFFAITNQSKMVEADTVLHEVVASADDGSFEGDLSPEEALVDPAVELELESGAETVETEYDPGNPPEPGEAPDSAAQPAGAEEVEEDVEDVESGGEN